MTAQQYIAALARLGLTPSSRAAAEALGISLRSSQRYAAGERTVPKTVELLLQQLR
jgi:hypothetical protein